MKAHQFSAAVVDLSHELVSILGESLSCSQKDNVPRLAAALAFYTTFSLAPALVIGLVIAGSLLGSNAAESQLTDELVKYIGPKATSFVFEAVRISRERMTGTTATLIGVVTSLFGATVAFAELRSALNTIWKAKPNHSVFVLAYLYERLISFTVVLCIGALLTLSVAFSVVITTVDQFFTSRLPLPANALSTMELSVSFVMGTFLLAALYKLLPEERVSWGDVWFGAIITASLIMIGKRVMEIYLASSSLQSIWGAAGSFVVLLIWIYYSAQVLYFGAELTYVYARRHGSKAQTPEDFKG